MVQINHAVYQKSLKSKTVEQLQFIIKDAREAAAANPQGEKAGYYQDEVLYAGMELKLREVKAANTWTRCCVARAEFGPHGGKQMRSKRYFVCGCDDGMCEAHAKVPSLGGPRYEPGKPLKCKEHRPKPAEKCSCGGVLPCENPAAHFEMPEPEQDKCGMVEASTCPDCGSAGTCEECVADAGIDAVADATSSHCGPTGGSK